jgi:hypothetical protein
MSKADCGEIVALCKETSLTAFFLAPDPAGGLACDPARE